METYNSYTNNVIINGVKYTNIVTARSYNEARLLQKQRKQRSLHKFEGRLTLLER